jgi:hypothetical protein
MSDDQTPADENLEPLFALSDIADPAVFLAGAVIPLAPHPSLQMPPTNAYFWCRDHLIISDSEEGAAMRINSADVDIFDVLLIDLSDPDVARWVDRKIAEAMLTPSVYVQHVRSAVFGSTGHHFFLTLVGSLGEHSHMVVRPSGRPECLHGLPCDGTHIPAARARLLRVLFGGANV